jgi:WD40 repeat protein
MMKLLHKNNGQNRRMVVSLAGIGLFRLAIAFILYFVTTISAQPPVQDKAVSKQSPSEKPELVLQTGHSQKAEAIAFSPDGRYLATGGVDQTIKIWDVATGRELRTLTGHVRAVKAVAFSPDAKLLASGGADGKIKLWEIASGSEVGGLPGHTQAVNALVFSRDGRWLASGGADFAVKLWDVAARREERSLVGHTGWVLALAFSPDGSLLASGSLDATIRLWSLSSKRKPLALEQHTAGVKSLAFSPDGAMLASGGLDHKAWLWRLPKAKPIKRGLEHSGGVLAVAFSLDGAELLTCAEDRTIRRFNAANPNEASVLPDKTGLNKFEIAVFSPDGHQIAASVGLPAVELRQVSTNSITRTFESRVNPILSVAFSPDGRWLATGNTDTTITLWDVASGRAVALYSGNEGSVTSVVFSPDSGRLASGAIGGKITLWDISTGRESRPWVAHANGVNSLAFTPDGQQLISSGVDDAIRIWDAKTGTEIGKLIGHAKDVRAISLSADGKRLASGGSDRSVRLWDLKSRSAVLPPSAHAEAVFAVAMSADGRWLASGGADRLVKIRDAVTGREAHTLAGANGRIDSLAFSPDGRWLAAGAASGEIKVWETATGKLRFNLAGHAGGVNALCFGPGGRWLISGSEDGSARAWEIESGEPAATLVSLRNSKDWLVATPDGLFDGSPEAWSQILWSFARDAYNPSPVEIFFNEFFYPDLLAEVLSGKRPRAREDIALLDRRQPRLKLVTADGVQTGSVTTRNLKVKIEVAERSAGSGARDLRLFRNGSLVKVWRGNVLKAGGGAATLECELPLVAGENRLTAYAFNRDNVKSADETLTITGSKDLARSGTLYILAIGINRYANEKFDLKFAVADAELFSGELERQQRRIGRFARVEPVKLLDDKATKANLLAALKRLGGGSPGPPPAGAPADLERLKPAQPEDAVIIYFAGHGVALDSRFYLIPHDLGYRGKPDDPGEDKERQVMASSVSDAEIEQHLETVDAGHLLLIVDACESGKALDPNDKRGGRGPMNSKGLAQLAYDKGMNILTASDQAALESSHLGHGYLTYALVADGIKTMAADNRPPDGHVWLREWLDYATDRVPRLQDDRYKETSRGKRDLRLELIIQKQRPRVFYRREVEAQPLVIAKP